ncbi:Alpha/Beta hydrolase protein [Leptodontidium sp. 2 PMI_412]|nr:Alpha/Beta hydrolase protein [Leptodontidium sp. 2 PMI_412]
MMSWIQRLKDKRKGKEVGGSDQATSQSRDASASVLKEVVGLFPVEDNPSSQPFDIDIVAIHGLGGHYQKTWTDGDCNWLRDFLPGQLRDSDINPRVMCYGYDAGTAFSKSVLAIHNVAEDLLDRLRLCRKRNDEKQRPIILIAHSLGGLVVKKAMNTAWNNPATYGPLLEKVYGLVFFGVPHRGADLAYWAGLPASLLDHALVGFGGNRSFLKALEKNSDEWRSISRDFTQRGAGLSSIRTFFETERLGNIWVSLSSHTLTKYAPRIIYCHTHSQKSDSVFQCP